MWNKMENICRASGLYWDFFFFFPLGANLLLDLTGGPVWAPGGAGSPSTRPERRPQGRGLQSILSGWFLQTGFRERIIVILPVPLFSL